MERTPPYNLEAEACILGAILLDSKCLPTVLEHIEVGNFYRAGHGIIYDAVLNLYNRSEKIDLITLVDELQRSDRLDKAGGAGYIAGLPDLVPTASHVELYCKIVKNKSILRELITIGHEIASRAYEDPPDVGELIGEVQGLVLDIGRDSRGAGFVEARDGVVEALRRTEAAQSRGAGGLSTGYKRVDYHVGGLYPGELTILAARTGVGKTGFSLNLARNISRDDYVIFFSLETTVAALCQRLLSMETRIPFHSIRHGYIETDKWTRLHEGGNKVAGHKLIIVDNPRLTIDKIRSLSLQAQSKWDVKLIIVDYLQLIRLNKSGRNREQEVALLSKELKAIAKETGTHVLALSQLSRAVDQREDKRPRLSDLRESGAIEQDANSVWFIYDGASENNTVEIILAKNPVGICYLTYEKEIQLFREYL